MHMVSSMWTREHVLALASDDSAQKAGLALALAKKWTLLGQQAEAVWGLCQGSGKDPYRTSIALTEPAFACSCPSRKFPCKHGLGLLLLHADQAVPAGEPPEWVTAWLEARRKRAEKKAIPSAPSAVPPETEAKRAAESDKRLAQREARIHAGLEEAERFLHDILRQGVSLLPQQPYAYFDTQVARLIDAQAPGLAEWLRALPSLVSNLVTHGEGWQERVLEHLGLMQLLIDGYRKQNELSAALRADVRTLMGWTLSREELLKQPGTAGTWQVLGQRMDASERVKEQRTWLWNANVQQMALLLDFAVGTQGFDASWVVGMEREAVLIYAPSVVPLRAVVKDQQTPLVAMQRPHGGHLTWSSAHAAWLAAKGQLPWLQRMPLLLQQIIPVTVEEERRLYDPSGVFVPFHGASLDFWRLVALSVGEPLCMMGEYTGAHLHVLGAYDAYAAQWLALGRTDKADHA